MMKTKLLFRLLFALSLLVATLPAQTAQAAPATYAAPANLLQFTAGGHALGFATGGMYAATGSHALHVDFTGANAVRPQADTPGSSNGSAVPLRQVLYADLWDGITLAFTADAGSVYTTTYTLAPGADPADIRLRYNAPLTLNEDGTLRIAFETGTMTESAPIAWQEIHGQRVPVDVSFRVSGEEVTFALGAYNPRYALTIDPSLTWNTFLGSSNDDYGSGIAVDGSGNVYVTGYSYATWGSPVRAYSGGNKDAFAAKLNSSGTLIWNTFLGGSDLDQGYGIAVDGTNVYVAGESYATWGSPVQAYTAGDDAFAAKLNSSTGALTWNTFLGGSDYDTAAGVAVDGSGNVYIAGSSYGTWGTPVRPYGGGSYDAFAVKLTSAGVLSWNTFLGGSGNDFGQGIAVDGSGNVYVAGNSGATWWSPVRAYTAGDDAFAAKLNSFGGLTWNTFLGGSGDDYGQGIAVDGSGNVYVAGYSGATWGSPVHAYTADDAFAAKLTSSGGLTWNTFLGGSGVDKGYGIAVDGSGNVYVTGSSDATWGSPVRAYSSGDDAFAAKLNAAGAQTVNIFLGGSGNEKGNDIALDGSGNVYVAGNGGGTWGSPVRAYGGGNSDAFAAKLDLALPGTFNKVSPTNSAYVQAASLTLTWGSSSDVTAYEYCIDTFNNNACDESWISTGTGTSVGLSGLINNRTYYWQVRATNAHGITYANGSADPGIWWSFTARNQTFADVPIDHQFWTYIEAFYNAGITTGCGVSPLIYCPDQPVTRAAMAVFLLRAKYSSSYAPPAASHYFSDLPVAGKEWMEPWVDQLYREGITGGCGTGPLIYCPETATTRAAMAVFILRAIHGSSYIPPAASHYFSDMPVAGKEWMEPWVDEFYREGITTGCGTGPLIYCPETAVKRGAMAAFIVRAFGIPLP